MRLDYFQDGGNFFRGKAELLQNGRRLLQGVSDVVPFCQGDWIFGAMTEEYAKIMHPRRREKDVFIEGFVTCKTAGECKQSGLMAELVGGPGICRDVFNDLISI